MISTNWLFFFMEDNLPSTTVNLGLQVLTSLCGGKYNFQQKFKSVGGFKELERILPSYSSNVEIYYTLLCLMVGKSVLEIPLEPKIDFPEILATFRVTNSTESIHILCPEAAHLILTMLKRSYEESYESVSIVSPNAKSGNTNNEASSATNSPPVPFNPVFDDDINNTNTNALQQILTHNIHNIPFSVGSPNRDMLSAGTLGSFMGKVANTAANKMGNIKFRSLVKGIHDREITESPNTPQSPSASTDEFDDERFLSRSDDEFEKSLPEKNPNQTTPPASPITTEGSPRTSLNLTDPSPFSKYRMTSTNKSGSELNVHRVAGVGVVRVESTGTFPQASKIQQNILKYFVHLYEGNTDFQTTCTQPEFLEYLANIVFPNGSLNILEPIRDDRATPPSGIPQVSPATPSTPPRNGDNTTTLVFMILGRIIENSLKNSLKAISIIEHITEASPLNSSGSTTIVYVAKIFMDSMHSTDSMIASRADFENDKFSGNLAKFCSLLVDYVNAGLFLYGARPVFHYLIRLLSKLETESPVKEQRSIKNGDLQLIYKSLYRILLFLLSQNSDQINEAKYAILCMIQYHKIILSPNNTNDDLIPSMCQHLFRFLLVDDHQTREGALNVWRLLLVTKTDTMDSILSYKTPKGEMVDLKTKGFDFLIQKDFTNFSFWMGDNISMVQNVFDETLKKNWVNLSGNEKKISDDIKRHLKERRQHRISRKERKMRLEGSHHEKLEAYKIKSTSIIHTVENSNYKKRRQTEMDRTKYVQKTWEELKEQLLRERGVWGNDEPSYLDKWLLDSTEGPFRMRKKMERNFDFYKRYPYYPPEARSDDPKKIPLPTSTDSEAYFKLHGLEHEMVEGRRDSTILAPFGVGVNSNRPFTPSSISPSTSNYSLSNSTELLPESPSHSSLSTSPSQNSGVLSANISPAEKMFSNDAFESEDEEEIGKVEVNAESDPEWEEDMEEFATVGDEKEKTEKTNEKVDKNEKSEKPDADEADDDDESDQKDQKILRQLQPGDKIQNIFNCGSVDGMDKVEGIFLFCTSSIYVIDGYRKDTTTGEITEVEEKINTDWFVDGHSNPLPRVRVGSTHNCRRWAYEDIREILRRRYLLRQVAIEMFSTDGRNHLVVFDDLAGREEVFRLLSSLISASPYSGETFITGSQSGEDYLSREMGVKDRLLTTVWKREPPTQLWQAGKISNFQYLMHLNTLAGRSYNDLTQYPVFPWVLQDYTSSQLDLNNPAIYRDLSKPMGALNEERAEEFRERFEVWESEGEEEQIPKFHYGTHYSSAAIVLYYLIRLEPFTQHFLKLQGGRWDHPDRLFHSIQESWFVCSEGTTGSVMELIPEFYYLPEFLENRNKFNLGEKQAGVPIADVLLPPWAHGCAREFIRKHRQALESDYVSEHLHEWIDLVFGYKQQGKAAEEALNVFYYLTYEGAIDMDTITDPVRKAAVESMINNFGQTPKQLFDKPHPKRSPSTFSTSFYTHAPIFSSITKETNECVGNLRVIGTDKIASSPPQKLLLPPSFTKQIWWGLPDLSVRVVLGEKFVEILENPHDGQITCMCATEDGKIAISGGKDTVVNVYSYQKNERDKTGKQFQIIKRLCGHTAQVTCVTASRPYSVIVSGSEDKTCVIWDLNRLRYVRSLGLGSTSLEGTVSAVAVHDVTGDIVAISGSTVAIWTINGDLLVLCRTSLMSSEIITCCLWSKGYEWFGENVLVTGQRDGKIKVWQLTSKLDNQNESENEKEKEKEKDKSLSNSSASASSYTLTHKTTLTSGLHQAPITSLSITHDLQKLYSGDNDGKIVCWSEVDLVTTRQRSWTLNASDLKIRMPLSNLVAEGKKKGSTLPQTDSFGNM